MLLFLLALLAVYHTVQRNTAATLERTAHNELQQLYGQLSSALERHAYLPALLAEDTGIRQLLQQGEQNLPLQMTVNRFLTQANNTAKTADIYLMRADGLTIAASNWADKSTFIGKNFAFRPYFQEAMRGETANITPLAQPPVNAAITLPPQCMTTRVQPSPGLSLSKSGLSHWKTLSNNAASIFW